MDANEIGLGFAFAGEIHRGKIVASLAFNLFPEQLRSERETWADLARAAGMDASRAFGYSGPAAPQATDEA